MKHRLLLVAAILFSAVLTTRAGGMNLGSAQILTTGELVVVPIPEASTVLGAGMLLGVVGFRERRRFCGILRRA